MLASQGVWDHYKMVRSDLPRAETGWHQWQILQVSYADLDQPNKQTLLYKKC